MKDGGNDAYALCNAKGWGSLDIDDPATSPNSHFIYAINVPSLSMEYRISAELRTQVGGGGNGKDYIVLYQNLAGTEIHRCGMGVFESIGPLSACGM